jgi:EpsI family protein
VPIVANWLRAYMIVMIGHLSDNKYAGGVDHLLYGWLFFGVVILLMYGVGSLWREDAVEASGSRRLTWPSFSPAPHRYPFRARWWAAAALVLPIAAIWPVASGTLESRISPADPIMAEVPAANGWTKIPADLSRAPKYVGYRASLHQGFEKDGGRVGLYIAYYRGQNQGAELVNSGNHVVSSLDSTSKETGRGTTTVGWAGEAFTARTTELERQGERFQAWRWYWIDGWLTSNDYVAKVLLALAKLSGRGDDAAAIVLYAAEDEVGGGAERAMTAFARDMAPGVNGVLERARGSPL